MNANKGWLYRLPKWILPIVVALAVWHYWPVKQVESVEHADGSRMKFRTNGDSLEQYMDGQWSPFFVKGVNVGAAMPGHDPGDLPISKETYRKWFAQIADLGSNVIRVYTILRPEFYEALVEYNEEHRDHPLYFIQGVWAPEEDLAEKRDAFNPDIYDQFESEVADAVNVVYGNADIPEKFGKASGAYRVNAGPYLMAWHIGTEWDPIAVRDTNDKHAEKWTEPFVGDRVSAKPGASPFENWLAVMLDGLAVREAQYGWQHPLTFTNWVTTDPLTHPGEVLIEEDLVGIDANHVGPVDWAAGYFASFHAYPYYPDFFRFDETLRDIPDESGNPNTYRSYLRQLKAHFPDMPVMITEFGVPSSLGIAHVGTLGRDQGGHNETEQGRINASLMKDIFDEGMAGAIVFSWQDEWFKRTWNTMDYELPASRRKLWTNVLTNEQKFGLLGMFSSKDGPLIIDGDDKDWEKLKSGDKQKLNAGAPGYKELWMTHDEAYVYLLAKLDQPFDPKQRKLYMGVDTIAGGNKHGKELAGRQLDEGLEALISLGAAEESEVRLAANYDFHTRLYGKKYGMFEVGPEALQDDSGVFAPWKLSVSLELIPPDTRKYHPFEEVPVGQLKRGTNNPDLPSADSLVMWEAKGNTVELRIPWMLLGFTDPSSLQVMSYADKDGKFASTDTKGIRLVPWIADMATGEAVGLEDTSSGGMFPVSRLPVYSWNPWEEVGYVERLKASYGMMKQAFGEMGGNVPAQDGR
ncbi:hypothetical protein [Paenibacillus oceani]|uniref:Family 2 glycosyl transferase n=1 Tax=Paenibacillus oceani TaxID=2772510 RepID=A0A927CA79_9BACL|nr:hypothetical protein [Paenibacillus oceani]MBD2864299.1 hypothetical protein [Paenibacillus oceani]